MFFRGDDFSPLTQSEWPGMAKRNTFGTFLNDTMLDDVNALLRTDDTVRNRFLDMVGSDGVPALDGLSGLSVQGMIRKTGEYYSSNKFEMFDTKNPIPPGSMVKTAV
jgi:hypothetical protein